MTARSRKPSLAGYTPPWLRLYAEVLNDPKVQNLDDASFRAWINVLCIARKYRGFLPNLSETAFLLRLDEARAKAVLERLSAAGLLDAVGGKLMPHNWKGRQYESDHSTPRVQRYRMRKRNVSGNVTETPPETDTEADTEKAVSNNTALVLRKGATAPQGSGPKPPSIRPATFTLAKEIAAEMAIAEGHPITEGMPLRIEHWLTKWHPEIILATVRLVMAKRKNDPPHSLKYFEPAIARAHAEQTRPMSGAIATAKEPTNVVRKDEVRGRGLLATIDRELERLEVEEDAYLAAPADFVLRVPG
jgi:hypothetical protein